MSKDNLIMLNAPGPLLDEELKLIDAYWRAANYLSVGQIYLMDNPLLKEPLKLEQIKPRLLGHWGTDRRRGRRRRGGRRRSRCRQAGWPTQSR